MAPDHSMGAMASMDPMASMAPATLPAAELELTLGRLLGEHALLAIAATQKGFAGAPDFEAAAAALDENSVEIADAIGLVFGPEVREEFLGSWRAHIGLFVDYTVGLATKDQAKADKAVADLTSYIDAFGQYLADAAGLPAQALKDGLTMHVMELKGQLDAYAAGDHPTAFALSREAYAHMFVLADALAGGIAARFPDRFPAS
jgi:hypothetical protein